MQFQAYGLLTEDSNARGTPKDFVSIACPGAVHLDGFAVGLSRCRAESEWRNPHLQMLRFRSG